MLHLTSLILDPRPPFPVEINASHAEGDVLMCVRRASEWKTAVSDVRREYYWIYPLRVVPNNALQPWFIHYTARPRVPYCLLILFYLIYIHFSFKSIICHFDIIIQFWFPVRSNDNVKEIKLMPSCGLTHYWNFPQWESWILYNVPLNKLNKSCVSNWK